MFCTIFNLQNFVEITSCDGQLQYHQIVSIEDRAKHYFKNKCTLIFIFFTYRSQIDSRVEWSLSLFVQRILQSSRLKFLFGSESFAFIKERAEIGRKVHDFSCKDFQGVALALSSYLTEWTENYCCFDFTSADQIRAGAPARQERHATGSSRQIWKVARILSKMFR